MMTVQMYDRVMEQHQDFILMRIYSILCTNDMVCGLIIDAHNSLVHSPLYKMELKRLANIVEKKRRDYEKKICSIIQYHNSEIFANINDSFCDEDMMNSLEMMFYNFKNTLDKYKVENSEILARMELARTMLDYGVKSYEAIRREFISRGIGCIFSYIDNLCLHELFSIYERMMACLRIGVIVDMNNDKCKAAFEVVVKKITDIERVARAIKSADTVSGMLNKKNKEVNNEVVE